MSMAYRMQLPVVTPPQIIWRPQKLLRTFHNTNRELQQ